MHDLTDYIDWDDVMFVDCETRSPPGLEEPRWADVTQTSTARYAATAWPIIITWAVGLTGEVKRWESKDITKPPKRSDLPAELLSWEAYFAAWNSAFDRLILDRFFDAGVDGWIDMMAQAAYNNMPMSLDRAAKACGYDGKVAGGKKLIRMFCVPDGATPISEPENWRDFCTYADVDVLQMQAFASSTMPVPFSIWEEFWASEKVNDRGIPVDLAMAAGGAALAETLKEQTGERLAIITEGVVTSVHQYARQREWVWPRLQSLPAVSSIMVDAHRLHPETGVDEYKFKMDRPIITRMVAALDAANETHGLSDEEFDALQFLELREFGASAAPAKFGKMLAMADARGRVPNQYIFNGATQTGRASSRGVQVHNMTRGTIGDINAEEEACAMLQDGCSMDEFEERWGNAGRALAKLIRPTIVAEPGKTFVWGDWSNIEARGLPWLAMAEHRLDLFRKIDANPKTEPDVYIHAAAGMYHLDPYEIMKLKGEKWGKDLRQKGKISELALGFNGGAGALQSMAANYGMVFGDDEAKDIVDRWRASNNWAVVFWKQVMEAFKQAYQNPGDTQFTAGRLAYQGIEMGNDVWVVCYLPDSRPLFYRNVRERTVEEYDPFEPTVLISTQTKLSFDGSDGVKYVWAGLLVENATQATCASILRAATTTLEMPGFDFMPVHLHTHDEVVVMTDTRFVNEAKEKLAEVMMRQLDWLDGFPLGVDVSTNAWYSKAVED